MSVGGKEKTVLLVEDNPDDVFLMERLFKKERIVSSLQVVTDGKMAIQYLESAMGDSAENHPPLPDLVFLDLKLPFLDGFDILAWIRGQTKLAALPVIVLTSSLEDRDREKAHAFGSPYLVKPPTIAMINEAVAFAEKCSAKIN